MHPKITRTQNKKGVRNFKSWRYQKYIPHYSYNDWVHWEGRWELIEGHSIAMTPMPLPEHQRIVAGLITELTLALRMSKCKQCKVYDSIDYKISENTIFEPNVLVVCGTITKPYLDFPPALVTEVLSKSTEEKDRGIKYDFYERERVKYYLMVDPKKRSIGIYLLVDGRYQLQEYKNRFAFTLQDDCTIMPELDNVWE